MYQIADKPVPHTCSLQSVCVLTKNKELLSLQPLPTHQNQYCATSSFSHNSIQHYREAYIIIIIKI